jgi:hypothetical protein
MVTAIATRQEFSYSAKRGDYLSIAATLIILTVAEAGAVDLVAAFVISDPIIKWPVVGVLVSLHIYVIFVLLKPLRRKHYIEDGILHIDYAGFKGDVPLNSIISAEPTLQQIEFKQALVAQYNAPLKRIDVAFSDQGQLILHLARLYEFRVGRKQLQTDQILLNVNNAPDFLQVLKLDETTRHV